MLREIHRRPAFIFAVGCVASLLVARSLAAQTVNPEESAAGVPAASAVVELDGTVPVQHEVPITIPVRDGEAPAQLASETQHFKVLVIDDELDSRVLMRHYLGEFGC